MKVVRILISVFILCSLVIAQDKSSPSAEGSPTPLATFIAEAEHNNADLGAAESGWQAATHVSRQVTTLPDPHFSVQQFSVGSPKPFAGFSNSDFAYIGFGASQDLPFPGTLRLRGEVADREADAQHKQADLVRSSIVEQVKLDYVRLGYLQQTLHLLEQSEPVLKQLVADATERYQVGQGDQQEILKAQLQRTKLLREVSLHHQEAGKVQAELKELLHRSQFSPDIVTEPLTSTPFNPSANDLAELMKGQNPAVALSRELLQKQTSQVALSKREARPDFNLGYEYERTGDHFRDYYMLTVGIQLPRKRRQREQVAEAIAMQEKSKKALDAELQRQLAKVQTEVVNLTNSEELLNVYKGGLLPQTEARYRSVLSAYEVNRQDFGTVLTAFLDTLNVQMEFQQAIAEHESALARLETLTGANLR
jgi:outer membrane protein, heavy metal efflux system